MALSQSGPHWGILTNPLCTKFLVRVCVCVSAFLPICMWIASGCCCFHNSNSFHSDFVAWYLHRWAECQYRGPTWNAIDLSHSVGGNVAVLAFNFHRGHIIVEQHIKIGIYNSKTDGGKWISLKLRRDWKDEAQSYKSSTLVKTKERRTVEREECGSKTQRSALVIYLCEDEAISGTTVLADLG